MKLTLNRVTSTQEHDMSTDEWYDYIGRVCVSVCSVPAMLAMTYYDTQACAIWTIAIGAVWCVVCYVTFIGYATR